jgi:hypothetical protein
MEVMATGKLKIKPLGKPLVIAVLLSMLSMGIFLPAQSPDDSPADEEQMIRRFALIIGANDGGKERVKLQYAVSDAKTVIGILERMGGVSPDDSRLLIEPSRDTLFWEMKRLKERVGRAKESHHRVEAIFYYSGHSDEKNILLGKEKVSYQEFRNSINGMAADVRIAILDSCASGAFTRLKGGKKKAPFLLDKAYNMKGYAVMTSSSSNEASQESERLKGSFFTHYLTSGLRGAADMTRDGRITLNEAYQFAFNETLAQTEKTVSGPQHPNYNIQMAGTGDVVITDIRKSSSILTLGEGIYGRLFIHNKDQVLVVELNKPQGRTIELGLEKGKYRIINIVDGDIYETRVKLSEGKTVNLHADQFKKSDKIDTVARGDRDRKRRNRVYKKRHKKSNFFWAYNSKYTRAHGKTAMLVGTRFGMTFNKNLSLGIAGYANSSDITEAHPAYGGVALEYAFPSRHFINLKISALVGAGEEELLNRSFFIFEPEVGITLNLTRLLNIGTGISYRFTSLDNSVLSRMSWSFSIRLGK